MYFESRGARNATAVLAAMALLVACTGEGTREASPGAARDGVERPTETRPLGLEPRLTGRQLFDAELLEPLDTPSRATLDALRPALDRRVGTARPRRNLWRERSLAAGLTGQISGARYVRGRGQTMIDRLAALPEDRRALGPAAFSRQEIFGLNGTPSICESPMIDADLTHDGETFEGRFVEEPYSWLTDLRPALYALSSTCTDALRSSAGQVATVVGAGCSREDEAAHFAAGSRCRTCLEVDGDFARCVGANACKTEMARTIGFPIGGRTEYFDVLVATALACAPDFTSEVLIAAEDLGEDNRVPDPFDHTKLVRWCTWHWNESTHRTEPFCMAERNGIHLAASDVIVGYVEWVRRPGDTNMPEHDRVFLAQRIEVEGLELSATPLIPTNLAEVSTPDRVGRGWGLSPRKLRPDGTDPTNPDHTFAREWVAAVALKTATRITGVRIFPFDRNVCSAEEWRGPDAKGRYFCPPRTSSVNDLPNAMDWSYDYGGFVFGTDVLDVEMYPLVTLAATGHMDPKLPGGVIPHVLGSPVLADPEWEGCAWPDTFEPDENANSDSLLPNDWGFTTQTYRFGKDPKVDVRLAIATNTRREFCFEPLPQR